MRVTRTDATPDPGRNPLGWLRTVVRSVARDLGRRELRLARPVPPREPGPDLERQLDTQRAATRAIEAFATLTPRQREAVDGVDRLGMSVAEVAAAMGVAPGTVRVLVHQGRKALRAHLLDIEEVVDGL
ncbi:MAG: sigma-70 family RNA polymerase sigma factor [Alphaproteobacteria bacterium]|nr:sigma-70 family RNA polymerase sigma factor [Alphaproteobacteria bacterium]